MINHKLLEKWLNDEAKKILLLIKEDYYQYMCDEKKDLIDSLIDSEIVIVNQGRSIFRDNTLAHGGRSLKDGKMHFYPDVRNYESEEEAFEKCKRILPHECFHYFLQPDKIRFSDEFDEKMARYYTEGLVEKETRKFHQKHKEVIDYEDANYGFNINFVNFVQNRLNVGSNEIIFGEDDYLECIHKFSSYYNKNENKKNELLGIVKEISDEFPKDMQKRVLGKMRTLILQNGNADIVQEKLQRLDFLNKEKIKKLKENDALEL